MRAAIISCGLLDTITPLVRQLSRQIEIDLYLYVYGERHNGTLTSFALENIPVGLVDEVTSARLLGEDLVNFTRGSAQRVRVRLFKYPSLKMLRRENFSLHRQFASLLNAGGYDLVHFNGYRGGLMVLYHLLDRRLSRVWTIHDPVQHSGEVKWQTKLGYASFRWLNAHFILHNESQLPAFRKQYKIPESRCHFVRLGPLEAFRLYKNGKQPQQAPQSVLFYGRISPYKGVEYLIKAAKLVRKRLPNLQVIIAGKPNYPIDLDALRNDPTFEIKDYYIENQELVRLIEESQLIACPYTDATQSGVVMTAYAFEKPVLATRVGGIPESVEDGKTGFLVAPRDADALAEKLEASLNDGQLLSDMRQNIREKSREGEWSWEKIAADTLSVYQQA